MVGKIGRLYYAHPSVGERYVRDTFLECYFLWLEVLVATRILGDTMGFSIPHLNRHVVLVAS